MYAFKIACWALIFIFRLRFPPGVSIATIYSEMTYNSLHGQKQAIKYPILTNKKRHSIAYHFLVCANHAHTNPDVFANIVYSIYVYYLLNRK